jgi:hypothetical protein
MKKMGKIKKADTKEMKEDDFVKIFEQERAWGREGGRC